MRRLSKVKPKEMKAVCTNCCEMFIDDVLPHQVFCPNEGCRHVLNTRLTDEQANDLLVLRIEYKKQRKRHP